MASPSILLTAGTLAASLLSAAPFVHNTHAQTRGAVSPTAAGIAVAAEALPLAQARTATVVAPAGVAAIEGAATGSPALAEHVSLTIVRAGDDATLFVGSLASFRSLPVTAGDRLRVTVRRDGGYRGLRAAVRLRWRAAA